MKFAAPGVKQKANLIMMIFCTAFRTPRIYAHIPSVNSMYSIYGFRFASGIMASACILPSVFFWLFFATAYTIPAKKPTPTAETDPNVTASPKNNIPEAATGNLFKAPTMLRLHVRRFNYSEFKRDPYLYVVLLVVRTHHAVVYDMPTAAAPENAIAVNKKLRVSAGL